MLIEARGPTGNRVQLTEGMANPPGHIDQIWINFALNDGQNLQDETLIRLLRNSKKIGYISAESIGDELSPERIELLEVIIARAESLSIYQWQSDLAYRCLKSCLSQQPNDGLKELHFTGGVTRLSTNQAQLLFEGVASSSSLKVLSMQKPSSVQTTRKKRTMNPSAPLFWMPCSEIGA